MSGNVSFAGLAAAAALVCSEPRRQPMTGSLASILARPRDVWSWGNIGSSALPNFELFFKRITFTNKRLHGTHQCAPAVHLQARFTYGVLVSIFPRNS